MDLAASHQHLLVDSSELPHVLADGERPRKLAVLGLPWDTSEETLKHYFAQFGPLEHAEVMKDRYTGKSRGFGFVTYLDSQSATQALATEHSIDGRRCEAKIALPKGEPTPPRTTRIFVARIPPSVTEAQFRQYFEQFGKLQDAYMPKDHSKQGYRGIGFVTFATPESVEKVMAVKHWMNGHEIAIDRATPKDEPSMLKNVFARMPLQNGQRRSFDNGSGIIGPGLTSLMNANGLVGPNPAVEAAFTSLRSLSEERELTAMVTQGMDTMLSDLTTSSSLSLPMPNSSSSNNGMPPMRSSQPGLGLGLGLGMPNGASAAAAAAAATTAALQTLQSLQNQANNGSMGLNLNSLGLTGMTSLSGDLNNGLLGGGLKKPASISGQTMLSDMNTLAVGMQQIMAAAATGRRSLDAGLKRMENPAIATARAGPRIFIGKLTKETSEADVKEYFMRFGYVMDVYLPKSKDNKMEHRGFGFVTFETEAAIQRVVSHGSHRLKGSTIAIDIAMPKVEDAEMNGLDAGGLDSPSPLTSFHALPNLMVQRI